jgi:hypothetical protein
MTDQKQKFNLRVAYLWSVHDFKAYSISVNLCDM